VVQQHAHPFTDAIKRRSDVQAFTSDRRVLLLGGAAAEIPDIARRPPQG
jgi:hypothetical protein